MTVHRGGFPIKGTSYLVEGVVTFHVDSGETALPRKSLQGGPLFGEDERRSPLMVQTPCYD